MLRVEVITDLLSCKIYKGDDQEMYDVSFNQGYLVPFKFDGSKFYKESYKQEDLESLAKKMEGKQKDDPEYLVEMKKLPIVLDEIKVLYKKDPESKTIDLVEYVKEFL